MYTGPSATVFVSSSEIKIIYDRNEIDSNLLRECILGLCEISMETHTKDGKDDVMHLKVKDLSKRDQFSIGTEPPQQSDCDNVKVDRQRKKSGVLRKQSDEYLSCYSSSYSSTEEESDIFEETCNPDIEESIFRSSASNKDSNTINQRVEEALDDWQNDELSDSHDDKLDFKYLQSQLYYREEDNILHGVDFAQSPEEDNFDHLKNSYPQFLLNNMLPVHEDYILFGNPGHQQISNPDILDKVRKPLSINSPYVLMEHLDVQNQQSHKREQISATTQTMSEEELRIERQNKRRLERRKAERARRKELKKR